MSPTFQDASIPYFSYEHLANLMIEAFDAPPGEEREHLRQHAQYIATKLTNAEVVVAKMSMVHELQRRRLTQETNATQETLLRISQPPQHPGPLAPCPRWCLGSGSAWLRRRPIFLGDDRPLHRRRLGRYLWLSLLARLFHLGRGLWLRHRTARASWTGTPMSSRARRLLWAKSRSAFCL